MPETTDNACLNLAWSLALLRGLQAAGVETLVLSPGSRSTPVVQAAARCPGLRCHTVLDERAAAFFALGLARAGGRPVALLATSGSAPAHWYPAVIEADAWGVPLILISADRPPELHGWGANQTTDQQRLFGTHARAFHDPGPPRPGSEALDFVRALGRRAGVESRWPRRGPVQINLPFREPLVAGGDCRPDDDPLPADDPRPRRMPTESQSARLRRALGTGRGVILCGPGDHPAALAPGLLRLARRWGLPVLADPLSGLRGAGDADAPLITRYDSFLRHPGLAARLRPDWALCLGREPVSKTLNQHLSACRRLLIDPEGRWPDSAHQTQAVFPIDPLALCESLAEGPETAPDPAWLAAWRAAEQATRELAEAFLAEAPWFEGHLIQTLLERHPADTPLLLGNSLPVRHFDTWSGRHAAAAQVYGNRGVSGIDGQVATLAGIAARHGRARGLIGDLSLAHDIGGLALARGQALDLLVINNGGGAIFDYLPQRRLPDFETHWRTPQDLPLADAAGLFGLSHLAVDGPDALHEALRRHEPGPRLIEILIDPARSHAQTQAWWDRLGSAPQLDPSSLLP